MISGWCMFGIGLACAAGGGLGYYMADKNYNDLSTKRKYWDYYTEEQKESLRNQRDKYHTISYAVMGVGGGILVTSIPLLSTGYAYRKNAGIFTMALVHPHPSRRFLSISQQDKMVLAWHYNFNL